MPIDLARSVYSNERANHDEGRLELVKDIEVAVYRPVGDRVAKPSCVAVIQLVVRTRAV